MASSRLNKVNGSDFNDNLLKSRLKRVPAEKLEKFLGDLKDIKGISKTKDSLASEIVSYYKTMKTNSEFILEFGNFIRDYVLSAGESEYLIEVQDKSAFITWINSWGTKGFIGNRFNFYKNTYFQMGEKYVSVETDADGVDSISTQEKLEGESETQKKQKSLSFPNEVFLLVAYRQESKSVFSKDRLIDIHDTFEFEIVLRKDTALVGVRGNYSVVRDFFSTAIADASNPLSMARSLFVGEFEKEKSRPIAKPRKSIDIEKLRQSIDGQYLDIDAPVAGDQATRIKLSLKGMRNTNEETHPIFGPAVQEAWTLQERSRIGFRYNGVAHSFSITKNGGLYFRKFAPEEVLTYVLLKISNL